MNLTWSNGLLIIFNYYLSLALDIKISHLTLNSVYVLEKLIDNNTSKKLIEGDTFASFVCGFINAF